MVYGDRFSPQEPHHSSHLPQTTFPPRTFEPVRRFLNPFRFRISQENYLKKKSFFKPEQLGVLVLLRRRKKRIERRCLLGNLAWLGLLINKKNLKEIKYKYEECEDKLYIYVRYMKQIKCKYEEYEDKWYINVRYMKQIKYKYK